jgi:hypothetical protein
MAPGFVHVGAAELPVMQEERMRLRVILGDWEGERSPVQTRSPMLYADAQLDAGARLALPAEYAERAAYVVQGAVEHDGKVFAAGELLVFRALADADVTAKAHARVLFLGGEPLGGPRFLWWNFVSSRKERLARAAEDWRAQRFAAVPGETDFIPLPDNAPRVADYP